MYHRVENCDLSKPENEYGLESIAKVPQNFLEVDYCSVRRILNNTNQISDRVLIEESILLRRKGEGVAQCDS